MLPCGYWTWLNVRNAGLESNNSLEQHQIQKCFLLGPPGVSNISSQRLTENWMRWWWISLNIIEYHWISLNIIEYHWISLNIIEYQPRFDGQISTFTLSMLSICIFPQFQVTTTAPTPRIFQASNIRKGHRDRCRKEADHLRAVEPIRLHQWAKFPPVHCQFIPMTDPWCCYIW